MVRAPPSLLGSWHAVAVHEDAGGVTELEHQGRIGDGDFLRAPACGVANHTAFDWGAKGVDTLLAVHLTR